MTGGDDAQNLDVDCCDLAISVAVQHGVRSMGNSVGVVVQALSRVFIHLQHMHAHIHRHPDKITTAILISKSVKPVNEPSGSLAKTKTILNLTTNVLIYIKILISFKIEVSMNIFKPLACKYHSRISIKFSFPHVSFLFIKLLIFSSTYLEFKEKK